MEAGLPELITKWAEGGTLNAYIENHSGCPLLPIVCTIRRWHTCTDAVCLKACGIANGLAYLHENDIIHADLKGVCALSYLRLFF